MHFGTASAEAEHLDPEVTITSAQALQNAETMFRSDAAERVVLFALPHSLQLVGHQETLLVLSKLEATELVRLACTNRAGREFYNDESAWDHIAFDLCRARNIHGADALSQLACSMGFPGWSTSSSLLRCRARQ